MIDTYGVPQHEQVASSWAQSYRELSAASRKLISIVDEILEDVEILHGDAARLTAAIDRVDKLAW